MDKEEVYHNILLNADVETLRSLCFVDRDIAKTCNNKYFWVEKFKYDLLPLPVPTPKKLNIDEYEKMLMIKKEMFDLLLVNFIEKNRSNKVGIMSVTKGYIQIYVTKEYKKDIENLLPVRLLYIIPENTELVDDSDEIEFISIIKIDSINDNIYDLKFDKTYIDGNGKNLRFSMKCHKWEILEMLTAFKYYNENVEILDEHNMNFSRNIDPDNDDVEAKFMRIGIYDAIEVFDKFKLF